MSKELTEQQKSGKLKTGHYYFKTKNDVKIGFLYKGFKCPYDGKYNTIDDVVEVLAPVPTYEEWEELQESNDGLSKLMFKSLMNKFIKADEERERLEEQLKEANNLLLGFLDENICSFDHNGYCQEHSSTEPDYRCIQQQLKWYFKKYEVLK